MFLLKKFSKKSGFTLVELLIVVSIVGILAAIIIVRLNDSKIRARDKSVLSTMATIQKNAAVCSSSLSNIVAPSSGTVICASGTGGAYPDLTANNSGWVYTASYATAPGCTQDLTSSDGNFTICAQNTGTPAKGIRCNEGGCTATNQ